MAIVFEAKLAQWVFETIYFTFTFEILKVKM